MEPHVLVIVIELCARLVELLSKLLDLSFFLAGSASVQARIRLLDKILDLI